MPFPAMTSQVPFAAAAPTTGITTKSYTILNIPIQKQSVYLIFLFKSRIGLYSYLFVKTRLLSFEFREQKALLSHGNSQIGAASLTYEYATVHSAPLIEHKRVHYVNTAFSTSFTFALLDKVVQHV